MPRWKAIVFDLDNTLYEETVYVFAAYEDIAKYIADLFELKKEVVYKRLIEEFEKKGSLYPRLFNDVLEFLSGKCEENVLQEVLLLYDTANPESIALYAGVPEILRELRQYCKLGLLTNGRTNAQKRKVELLRLESFFDEIAYARELGAEKPSPLPYISLLQKLGASPGETLFVGDNPYTDFAGAQEIGASTVRVLQGEFKDVPWGADAKPTFTISSLQELHSVVLL